ncbi:MAG: (deoxy)nucleoside triphosphate pyrophosphohydrolase [Ignavibacteria bacterium]|nr:(deoxy)nucleoside triphosphate pyrophosphohydrolase [Ignavibacteria bacterium]
MHNVPVIGVSVGIICKNDTVLLCQRNETARYALQWEFPGGKIEKNETPENALIRELQEELGITAEIRCLIHSEESVYPDGGKFFVHFYLIENYSGKLRNKVFNTFEWVKPINLLNYNVLEGNITICRNLPTLLETISVTNQSTQ